MENRQLVTHKSTLVANQLLRSTLDGREHVIVPIVALVAGVVNGELVPVEELAAFVAAWDGRPVPLRHPQDADGNYISANSPSVIESSVIGQVFNMTMDGDRLKGELWLDVAKCAKLGGDAMATLQRLEAGQVVEVSTAYFCDVEPTAGTFNGIAYSGIQHNLRPDHVALLPDQRGACSVAEGCGANRINLRANADLDFAQSIMVAFYLRAADAQALALAPAALPEGSQVLPANELHITLAYLGEIEAAELEFNRVAGLLAEIASDQVVIFAATAGRGRFTGAEGDMDAVFALVDSDALHQFRYWLADVIAWDLDYDISRRWGFIPHITLGYVPIAAPVALPATPRQDLVLDRLALSWGEQVIEFPLQGVIRDPAAAVVNQCRCSEENMNEQEKKQAKAKLGDQEQPQANEDTQAAEDTATALADGVATLQLPALPAELTELATALREFGGVGALMEAVKGIKANSDRQKAQLVQRLAANSRCAFSQAELEAMGVEQLAKLEASIVPGSQTYVGRNGAGPAVNLDGDLRVYKGAAGAKQEEATKA